VAAIQEGDVVCIDIPNRRLELEVEPTDIRRRLDRLPAWDCPVKRGYLRRYAQLVTSANTGAVLRD
jgi:dihydroxy-acid dehydratase